MPMKRHLYPKNWDTIATIIKYMADWHCTKCGRPCRRPRQTWDEFCSGLLHEQSKWCKETDKPGRFVLTVAHLDQNPGNNNRENLKALCPTCHNRHDAKARAVNRSHTRVVKLEDAGQLRLGGL
ncbi:HNH endonuclease [[Leptolyngbya] sp. PCC 7376]|uniref:hypothetical protein n=1 Tax=[Leptolyngbya] sp. PCC 7376 TaxID=111781 RepID=UPI00029ED440|nr:hypothetical protein [[Leptolyngbya] sp. PCC 7376]AFY39881.1 HNH endonuclease [[Leptolyngbya] sp. PCC 7376]